MDDLAPLRNHLLGEFLDAFDALGHRHSRPCAATIVVSRHRGVERFVAFRLSHHRYAPDFKLLHFAVGRSHANGRQHRVVTAVPCLELAIQEISALADRRQ